MPSTSETKVPPPEKDSMVKKAYLLAYNTAQVVAWSLVFLKAAVHYSEKNSTAGLYSEVEFWLKIAQTAAILEIFHCLFGVVRSSVFTTLPQVASRLFILWVVADSLIMKDVTNRNTVGFPMLLFAWTITEIIRYSYYANALVDSVLAPLQWCRYTFFIVLYPMGVAGELICFYRALSVAMKTDRFSIRLPNVYNFSVDFVWLSYFIFMLYIPGFHHLYTYMFRQRGKVLGSKSKAE